MAEQVQGERYTNSNRAIGPIGTFGRVVLGLGFLYIALATYPFEWGLRWHSALLGLVAFPAATILGVELWKAATGSSASINATGPIGFCANFAVGVVLFMIPFTRDAALLFYGTTLLLAAVRGYAGCEVAAISNWLLHRDDQVGCVVFSPVDQVEAQMTRTREAP